MFRMVVEYVGPKHKLFFNIFLQYIMRWSFRKLNEREKFSFEKKNNLIKKMSFDNWDSNQLKYFWFFFWFFFQRKKDIFSFFFIFKSSDSVKSNMNFSFYFKNRTRFVQLRKLSLFLGTE